MLICTGKVNEVGQKNPSQVGASKQHKQPAEEGPRIIADFLVLEDVLLVVSLMLQYLAVMDDAAFALDRHRLIKFA